MKKGLFIFVFCLAAKLSLSQKIEGIYFNLYTDSLKKGFYNYISIDGKDANGNWLPLDSTQIIFSCNTGHFKGNDLFIDSSYTADTVVVKAALKRNPQVVKEITIYIRKRPFTEVLKTNEEVLGEIRGKKKKS